MLYYTTNTKTVQQNKTLEFVILLDDNFAV